MSLYNINNKLIKGSYGLITACEPYTPPGLESVIVGLQGNQQEWLKYNLSIDDGQGGIVVRDIGTVNGVNMGIQYYYTYEAAVRVANSVSGWHLPTKSELETLQDIAAVGQWTPGGLIIRQAGMTLKSNEGWNEDNGIDYWGFAAYPVGEIISNNPNTIVNKGSVATYWSITENNTNEAYNLYFGLIDTAGIGTEYKNCYKSIRLIKD